MTWLMIDTCDKCGKQIPEGVTHLHLETTYMTLEEYGKKQRAQYLAERAAEEKRMRRNPRRVFRSRAALL